MTRAKSRSNSPFFRLNKSRAPAALLETLELRALLVASNLYDFVPLTSLPGFEASTSDNAYLVGISPSGDYMWSRGATLGADADAFIVDHATVRYLRDIPALAGKSIVDITSAGKVLYADSTIPGYIYDLVAGGSATSATEGINIDSGSLFSLDAVKAVAMNDHGLVVLQTRAEDQPASLWAYVASSRWSFSPYYLWTNSNAYRSTFLDLNESGEIVGYASSAPMVLRDDGIERHVLPLIGNNPQPIVGGINENGDVICRDSGPISIWTRAGTIEHPTNHLSPYALALGNGGSQTPLAIEDDGTLHSLDRFSVTYPKESSNNYGLLVVRNADNAVPRVAKVSGAGLVIYEQSNDYHSHLDPGYLRPAPASEFSRAQAGNPAPIISDGTQTVIVGYRGDGYRSWFSVQGDAALVHDLRQANLTSDAAIPILNPRDASIGFVDYGMHTVLTADARGWNYRLYDWFTDFPNSRDGCTFSSADDRRHFAFPADDGDLMLQYEIPLNDSSGSDFNNTGYNFGKVTNLSQDHFRDQGLDAPPALTNLAAFTTVWGGSNIFGLDSSGNVWTVWWAPGMTYWRADNLSAIADAPSLSGSLVAFATPWGAMHVSGTSADGHVQSVWWSPALGDGNWTVSDLTNSAGAQPVAVGSLAGGITPWNGLSIYARDAGNKSVAIWWAPGRDAWTYESISAKLVDSVPDITGPLSSWIDSAGVQNISGVAASGDVIRLYWMPSTDTWHAQNVSEMIRAG
ncbi:MAG: hypothetical protein JNL50_04265 [Phycisphaerae bacterium]|nr:hypothetical protein [Phycisphaerae bacterium]